MSELSIIPWPNKLVRSSGFFHVSEETIIESEPKIKDIAQILKEFILIHYDLDLLLHTDTRRVDRKNKLMLTLDPKLDRLGKEGYILQIGPGHAAIQASKKNGIFYGIQSLKQLFPMNMAPIKLPHVLIEDKPRFKWRGFMLDEGRHFFGKAVVKKLLDAMALMKLNTFHWHLTEDQGWRIEIKKYPKLIEIGSKRTGTQRNNVRSEETDGIPHEGHYTQEEIKEIVDYANERFITTVPEIEMPGHSQAALAAYPELSCTGGPHSVPTTFGIKKEVYCVGKENVIKFLKDVLKEVFELFPSEIIHLGGDEVPKDRWKGCPHCQARMQQEHLEDEDALQAHFFNEMAKFLAENGRRTIGWNVKAVSSFDLDVTCHYWYWNLLSMLKNLKKGRKYVMSRTRYTYLDHSYRLMPLKKTYNHDPVSKRLDPQYHENVLGIEAPMWTEWVRTEKRLYHQVFPRLMAIAETAWTPRSKKDFNSFQLRLKNFYKHLILLDIEPAPLNKVQPSFFQRIKKVKDVFSEWDV